jgi:large subunit ribosomal protein L30e
MDDIASLIRSVVKSGRAFYGAKQSLWAARLGRAVALIVAGDCPKKILAEVEKYASLSNIPVFKFPRSGRDLGLACGKPFSVSAIAVREIPEKDLALAVKEAAGKAR